MSRLLTFATGNVTRFLILAVTILLFPAASYFGGQLESVQENEASSFLPSDAESSKALEQVKRFPNGENAAAIVVYRRDGGLTDQDRKQINVARDRLRADLPRDALAPLPPQISRDGSTALVIAAVKASGDSDRFTGAVEAVKDELTVEGDPGLQQKLTGPAGFSLDAIDVFGDIDTTLVLSTGLLVLVLLLIIYRSPIFWLFPFLSVVFAEVAARGLAYGLAEAGVTVNGQSAGILPVLVFGAGTDYALLLVARYREELRRNERGLVAIRIAVRRAGVPIVASGLTVIAALLCLSLAEVNGTAGLGPIGAMGVAVAMVTMLTVLPAALAVTTVIKDGRWAFWPFLPRFGSEGTDETHGLWRRLGNRIAARPRAVTAGTTAFLLLLCLGLLTFNTGLTQGNSFRGDVESVQGQDLIDRAFPAGSNAPTDVVVPDPARARAVTAALAQVEGVSAVRPTQEGPPGVLLQVVLDEDPYSTSAFDRVGPLRAAAKRAGGEDVLVGGPTATEKDLRAASARDTRVIVPIALFVVFLILVVLLRAVVAPLMLMGTVILSFAAALGVGSFFSTQVFGFPGFDPGYPLFVFIFLVALGIDYNIFLMARVREESIRHGTRAGMLRGLAVTGGVITSAGIVLAGTFSVLAVLPLVFLTELGFTVAIGVLLDTFIVRSILVPALTFDLGRRIWWPSALSRSDAPGEQEVREPELEAAAAD